MTDHLDLRRSSAEVPEIHLLEPTGLGGIFQHTCQLANELSRHGRRVVLHTSHEHESVDFGDFEVCKCSWWPRRSGDGAVRTKVRKGKIVWRLVTRTLLHLVRSIPADAVLHLQGPCASGGVNLAILSAGRRAHLRVVYSPHDLFSRMNRLDGALLRVAYRLPHAIVVYSKADAERLRNFGSRVHYSPLTMLVPRPGGEAQLRWREAWSAETVVLFAGDVRPDKRLDLLVQSACSWPPQRRLAVVGRDNGGWARSCEIARMHNIDIAASLEFADLDQFAAAIAAADLVVVPSDRASQSAVLALARQLGTPTVAADVGGMGELASHTFRSGDVDDLNCAIQAILDETPTPAEPLNDDEAVYAHLRAYGEHS